MTKRNRYTYSSSFLICICSCLVLNVFTLQVSKISEEFIGQLYKNLNLSDFTVMYESQKALLTAKYRTLEEKVINAGYRIESHKIVTEDGYILTAFRIPGKLTETSSSAPKQKKKPITLTHGLLDDAYTWLYLNNTISLPIRLANEGYDVWLMNIRGNTFSLEHLNRETHNSDLLTSSYWDFCLDDIIKYDVKANIEYVRQITGFEKIVYGGHSQGTFIYFMAYTLYKDYLERTVEKFVGIGAAYSVFYTNSPYLRFFRESKLLETFLKLGLGNMLVIRTEFHNLIYMICEQLKTLCMSIIESIVDINPSYRIDKAKLTEVFYYEPGGTSVKNLLHWIQLATKKKHSYFDYGSEKNKLVYGSPEPPCYNTTVFSEGPGYRIKSFITTSENDALVYPQDILDFVNLLPNKSNIVLKNLTTYGHLDYVWADDASKDIYDEVLEFLEWSD